LYIVCMFDELRLRQSQRSVILLDSCTSTLASLSRYVEVCVAQSLLSDFLRHLEFVTSSMVSGISSCTLHLSESRSGIVGLVVSGSGLFPMSKCLVEGKMAFGSCWLQFVHIIYPVFHGWRVASGYFLGWHGLYACIFSSLCTFKASRS
jgi:hypothetical protein